MMAPRLDRIGLGILDPGLTNLPRVVCEVPKREPHCNDHHLPVRTLDLAVIGLVLLLSTQ